MHLEMFVSKILTQGRLCLNVLTTPLRQWGFRQCLHLRWTKLRSKHCWHPIAVTGVVDTFRQCTKTYLIQLFYIGMYNQIILISSILQYQIFNYSNSRYKSKLIPPINGQNETIHLRINFIFNQF